MPYMKIIYQHIITMMGKGKRFNTCLKYYKTREKKAIKWCHF